MGNLWKRHGRYSARSPPDDVITPHILPGASPAPLLGLALDMKRIAVP